MSDTAAIDGRARVAVMGSGSWGTGFALVLSDAGNQVTLWARRRARRQDQHGTPEPGLLSGLTAAGVLEAVSDPHEAMNGAEFVVLAVYRHSSSAATSVNGGSSRTPSW